MIFHIPHSSTHIPEHYLPDFALSPRALDAELLAMTDRHTLALFACAMNEDDVSIVFPYSRLLVDVERFEQDDEEPMNAVGMGCIYTKTHDGKPLKHATAIREKLLAQYYRPHHARLNRATDMELAKQGVAVILDCHSFPKEPHPYEFDQTTPRADICLGTDPDHTPDWMMECFKESFEAENYSVAINQPFVGTIVPSDYYRKKREVSSIMIEVRRDLYMNETTGETHERFQDLQQVICQSVAQLRVAQTEGGVAH